jgi:hypothetical protein
MGALEFLFVPPAAPGPPPPPGGGGTTAPGPTLTPFTLRGGTLLVSGKTVKVPMACAAAAAAPCQIAVVIQSTKPLIPRVEAAARKRRRVLTFGHGKVTIAPGKTGAARVTLSKKAQSLLRARKLSKVKVTASIAPGAAQAQTATKVYKIKRAKRRRR